MNIYEMNKEEIYQHYEKLKQKLTLPVSSSYVDITSFVIDLYSISNLSMIDMDIIEQTKNKLLLECAETYHRFVSHDEYCSNENILSWEKIFECMYYCYRNLQTCYQLDRMSFDNYVPSLNEDNCPITNFSFINYVGNTNYQNLLLYMLPFRR